MSRKQFEAIAEVIRVLRNNYGASIPAEALVAEISDMCARQNPRFDAGRFAKACAQTLPAPKPVVEMVETMSQRARRIIAERNTQRIS